MRLVFMGPPGAGKGTQSKWLVDHLSVPHLSTGEMLREAMAAGTEVGEIAHDYISQGQLVPDEVVIDIVARRIEETDCRPGFLLDGFPRTPGQAEALSAILASRGTPLDCVLQLEVMDQTVVDRMMARARADDRPKLIRERLGVYHSQTTPLISYYKEKGILARINGEGTTGEVTGRIQAVVNALRAGQNPDACS